MRNILLLLGTFAFLGFAGSFHTRPGPAGWIDIGSTVHLGTATDSVGIGTTNPHNDVHIQKTASEILVQSAATASGTKAQIFFASDSSDNPVIGSGVCHNDDGANGRGDLILFNKADTDGGDADCSGDARLTIESDGNTTITGNLSLDIGTGFGTAKFDGSSGGCIMLRDDDDAGWTQCDALNGTLTCAADDGDGLCD